jgi:hypothetical protein
VSQGAEHLRAGQLGTTDLTASTLANIGLGENLVGYTVAIAGIFTMSGGMVTLTLAHYTSLHIPWLRPARRPVARSEAAAGVSLCHRSSAASRAGRGWGL